MPRVGASDIQELSELGVIAVDLSQISNSKSGSHSKFAGSPEIVKHRRRLEQQCSFDRNQRATELQDVLGPSRSQSPSIEGFFGSVFDCSHYQGSTSDIAMGYVRIPRIAPVRSQRSNRRDGLEGAVSRAKHEWPLQSVRPK
ncbi:MAG: hypothetical protein JKP98_18940 [Rhodobacteraceae bacterium]|nr:hypothetical protein [Paracoccaceae bacterium]